MLPRTLHPHRKIAQTATASVGDAARGDDRHSTFGNCALRPPAAETVERGCDQFDLHRLLQPRGAPGRTKGAALQKGARAVVFGSAILRRTAVHAGLNCSAFPA